MSPTGTLPLNGAGGRVGPSRLQTVVTLDPNKERPPAQCVGGFSILAKESHMKAGELATLLLGHPDADVFWMGDEMSSGEIESVEYIDTANTYYIEMG